MEKLKAKYQPMIFVLYTVVLILVISLPSTISRWYTEDSSIISILAKPLFYCIFTILTGLIYCEINYWIKNLLIGSIIFGILAFNLFIFLLPISSLLDNGEIGSFLSLDLHLKLALLGCPFFSLGYFAINEKKHI